MYIKSRSFLFKVDRVSKERIDKLTYLYASDEFYVLEVAVNLFILLANKVTKNKRSLFFYDTNDGTRTHVHTTFWRELLSPRKDIVSDSTILCYMDEQAGNFFTEACSIAMISSPNVAFSCAIELLLTTTELQAENPDDILIAFPWSGKGIIHHFMLFPNVHQVLSQKELKIEKGGDGEFIISPV